MPPYCPNCRIHHVLSDSCMTAHHQGIEELRRKLTGPIPHREGEGEVTFTRTDGKTVVFDNVDYDSIGPLATNAGVISFNYFDTDDIVHVPFVSYWTVDYRV